MTTVVTGWTGRDYDRLGAQFIYSFDPHWPGRRVTDTAVHLMVFTDLEKLREEARYPIKTRLPTPRCLNTCGYRLECDGLAEFIERHKDNKAAHGREPNERWKEKEVAAGYSFRFDAVKFATQLFIPEAAQVQLPDGEILVWFDADVVTHRAVPENFIESLIGDSDLVHLGREPKHSEIGFWAVRLSPLTRRFLKRLADLYRFDKVFDLREWHSAFVFDTARKEFEAQGMRSKNLTPGGRGHVWPGSPLGRYTEHLKGKRKLRNAA